MKFYAMIPKSRSRAFKCDKIVIYYEKTNRNIVYQEVIDAAKAFRIPPTNFLTPISGFYHVAGTEDNSFLVGIGVEISGTSFTKERSKRIFQKLTGMTYNKNTADVKYRYIGTEPDEKVFIENLYSEVISDCPKF